MSEKEINEKYIQDKLQGICQDCVYFEKTIPIIREIMSKHYIRGLEQGKFDKGLELEDKAYEQVKTQMLVYKEKLDKINEFITNFSVDKNFSFPLMKRWEENQVKSSIEYQFNETLKKDIQKIIKGE